MGNSQIKYLSLSQEDLIDAGAFDMKMAREALIESLFKFRDKRILFPDKIVQIFKEETQERINCLPATLLDDQICGVKWVSVFPLNPRRFGTQNLSAIIVLSEIEKGYPICVMDGTLCSNMRVSAMGSTAADLLARKDAKEIGFIGAGEQAKMTFLGMMSVRPGLEVCRVGAKESFEEEAFIRDMAPLFPNVKFVACNTSLQKSAEGADIIVTATSAQAPLLKAAWIKPGAFVNHIGGWEDEYAVIQKADKIVCDDWNTVKHRTQTVSRCYKDGIITDNDIHANLIEILAGEKPGRESDEEFIYFDAVGLSYTDISIATAMYRRALENGKGIFRDLQNNMIFEKDLVGKIRL
ncbi:MAG: ornithine cyclodeaminase family protein [Lachnospiraceae bacterium]|nr:ornithine cyclodeaminase family protein [Lachnospiraceae bacterium]